MKEYNVTEFRKNALALINGVANSGQRFVVSKRSVRQAVVLPTHFTPVAESDVQYSKWLALMFTERLMPDAPAHIKEPQRLELEKLPISKLKELLAVDSLPVRKEVRGQVIRSVGKEVIERLEKRFKIAEAIIAAEKEGLYEAVEHQTGETNLA